MRILAHNPFSRFSRRPAYKTRMRRNLKDFFPLKTTAVFLILTQTGMSRKRQLPAGRRTAAAPVHGVLLHKPEKDMTLRPCLFLKKEPSSADSGSVTAGDRSFSLRRLCRRFIKRHNAFLPVRIRIFRSDRAAKRIADIADH